jgi:hypothetical protein
MLYARYVPSLLSLSKSLGKTLGLDFINLREFKTVDFTISAPCVLSDFMYSIASLNESSASLSQIS